MQTQGQTDKRNEKSINISINPPPPPALSSPALLSVAIFLRSVLFFALCNLCKYVEQHNTAGGPCLCLAVSDAKSRC